MCLNRGAKPSLQEFEEQVASRNYDHLCIWQSVGADVENGNWAILGARHGTYMTMLTGWDYRDVQDFDKLKELWKDFLEKLSPEEVVTTSERYRAALTTKLGLPIVDMTPAQSKFFKHHYATGHKNLALMATEISVIRKLEGW
jgi:hypothetical protein